MEPVNILLPYKARSSWIKQCWGKEVKHGSITDKSLMIIWACLRTERCCSPAEYGGNVTTATCWDSLMRHCGSNKHKDMSCNYRERRHLKMSLFIPFFTVPDVFLTPPCDYQGFFKWQKPPKEYFGGKKAHKLLKVWGAERYGCNHSGHQWQQLAVQSASASVLFPSLLLHPLHIQKLGTGSLMADSTQEILEKCGLRT